MGHSVVITIDFSKAVDSVRHKTLLKKVGQLDISEHVYNWLIDFLQDTHTRLITVVLSHRSNV